jgi:F0F1-type ATP synthase membrane subunit a
MVVFVRDDIAEKNIGHDGRKFTRCCCSFFFFILVAALLGCCPSRPRRPATSSVTLALATVSFFAAAVGGHLEVRLRAPLRGLVPPGLPRWLLPIMIPVEILAHVHQAVRAHDPPVREHARRPHGDHALLLLIPLHASITHRASASR